MPIRRAECRVSSNPISRLLSRAGAETGRLSFGFRVRSHSYVANFRGATQRWRRSLRAGDANRLGQPGGVTFWVTESGSDVLCELALKEMRRPQE